MTWEPGKPVATAQDQAEWQAWKKRRILEAQRARRVRYPRIDYYPSDEAMKLIEMRIRCGARSVGEAINALIEDWTRPEQKRAK